jgi:iron complex outermembrane receptor protein
MGSAKNICGVGHACLLIGAASVSAVGSGSSAYAQAEPSKDSAELQEIVVTAQKREQLVQDVPIAITAIDQAALQTNRVTSVTDLSGLAPNLVVRESAGDVGTPAFSMRGITSYGTVPGSDKEISIYLDGVYIGAPRGSIFDLPDISGLEVLRGPQGTLFGRNATAGAINITTRNPTGTFGVQEEVTFGNYGQTRDHTSVDLPAWGPFSAYISYVYNYKRGDIRNLGAGEVWDRPGSEGEQISPGYLGTHNSNSFFVVVEFEPNDSFKTTYKFDWSADYYTPDGVAAVGAYPPALGPVTGGFLSAVLAGSPPENLVTNGLRPSAVNNSWATEGYQRTLGYNLTSKLQLNDQSSLQNILAYRQAYVYANTQLDGFGGLVYPFPPIAGSPFAMYVGNNLSLDKQWSDELQYNYASHLLTMTLGALYYWQSGYAGGPSGMSGDFAFTAFPGGQVPLGDLSESYNKQTSVAAYGQVEFHIMDQLDLVGGLRETRDKKSGSYVTGGAYVPGADGAFGGITGSTAYPFQYQSTKPSYSLGPNYKPAQDVLVYAKYSTAFVSGGSVGGLAFQPEVAKSWDLGVKSEFLDHRLRANLALFDVTY